jgi:hypothetical protein
MKQMLHGQRSFLVFIRGYTIPGFGRCSHGGTFIEYNGCNFSWAKVLQARYGGHGQVGGILGLKRQGSQFERQSENHILE